MSGELRYLRRSEVKDYLDRAGMDPLRAEESLQIIEENAAGRERERMRAMRHDFQTLPHGEFPGRWPDWRQYEDVLPTYCSCQDCRLWRSGS